MDSKNTAACDGENLRYILQYSNIHLQGKQPTHVKMRANAHLTQDNMKVVVDGWSHEKS